MKVYHRIKESTNYKFEIVDPVLVKSIHGASIEIQHFIGTTGITFEFNTGLYPIGVRFENIVRCIYFKEGELELVDGEPFEQFEDWEDLDELSKFDKTPMDGGDWGDDIGDGYDNVYDKFEVGDEVVLNPSSEYYGDIGQIPGVGTICEYDSGILSYSYIVKWTINGREYQNSYRKKDLIREEPFEQFEDWEDLDELSKFDKTPMDGGDWGDEIGDITC